MKIQYQVCLENEKVCVNSPVEAIHLICEEVRKNFGLEISNWEELKFTCDLLKCGGFRISNYTAYNWRV